MFLSLPHPLSYRILIYLQVTREVFKLKLFFLLKNLFTVIKIITAKNDRSFCVCNQRPVIVLFVLQTPMKYQTRCACIVS